MHSKSQTQRGATLVVALVLLLLVTILGVTATQVALMQEKMSGNLRDKQVSFQAAESAVMQAEKWLLAQAALLVPSNSCSVQPCVATLNSATNFATQTAAWWASNGGNYTNATLIGVATQPKYYIEYNRFVPDNPMIGHGQTTGIHYYRVTARGNGGTNTASTTIQTTVAKRF